MKQIPIKSVFLQISDQSLRAVHNVSTIIVGLLSHSDDKILSEQKTARAVALLEESLCWPASCPPPNTLNWSVLLVFPSAGAQIWVFLLSLDTRFVEKLSFQFFPTWLKAIGTLDSYACVTDSPINLGEITWQQVLQKSGVFKTWKRIQTLA